jgi:C_GCAxxG_C_C family probable redox protein
MEDKGTEARNTAGGYFKEGLNCAESIIKTFRPQVAANMDESVVRLFTGFGGGYGHAGCTCGALAASVAVLGMLKGRTTQLEDREPAYNLAKEFHDKFEEKFGATCCRALNEYPFDTKEHLKNCLKITGNTAKLLAEFLDEKGLAK